MEEPSSSDFPIDPLEDLARELRQTVGSELRAEAEITEHEVETGRRRRRTMSDVVRESAQRGDSVSVITAVRTITGNVVQVGRDYLTVATHSELVDARLTGMIAVIRSRTAGGDPATAGSITFKARMSEYEQTREPVTLVAPRLGYMLEGTIEVVGEDHIVAIDRDGSTIVIPVEAIDLVVRPRPTQS